MVVQPILAIYATLCSLQKLRCKTSRECDDFRSMQKRSTSRFPAPDSSLADYGFGNIYGKNCVFFSFALFMLSQPSTNSGTSFDIGHGVV